MTQVSKFLSYILRHKPESIGLSVDRYGWAMIDEIIELADIPLDYQTIEQVVADNNKQRFTISDDGKRIRANQGHSIKVDVQLRQKTPPFNLYHGTADKNRKNILKKGLHAGNRLHVHLSADTSTAISVGTRHGKPIVFSVDTVSMTAAGFKFYQSENGVWLTDEVPARYLHETETTDKA